MARPEKIPLDVPAAVGIGQPSNVFRFRNKTMQVAGAFAGSLQLEGTIDGDNWEAVGAPITAPTLFLVDVTVELLRVRVTALTSGTPRAILAGLDYRAM